MFQPVQPRSDFDHVAVFPWSRSPGAPPVSAQRGNSRTFVGAAGGAASAGCGSQRTMSTANLDGHIDRSEQIEANIDHS